LNEPAHSLVSVVVPCHNAAGFLGETLDSILRQSHTHLEILLVDDGSDDDPRSIADGLGDERIRCQRIPASGGPSRPRNVGIREARGDYIFFCDADDVMLPGKIAAQVARLDAQPGLGLVFTNFQVIDAGGAVTNPDFLAEYDTFREVNRLPPSAGGGLDREGLRQGLLRANFIGTSGVAVRKAVLDAVGGFDESLASSEDLDLWLRIARDFDCGYVDLVGHSYRKHPASVMHQVDARHPLARIRVLERNLPAREDPLTRRAVRRRLADNHVAAGYAYQLNGDMARAAESYLRAFRLAHWPAALLWAGKCLLLAPLRRRRHNARA
jgi:glycosyltransferase involved in cell wall biosynthesis